MFFFYRRAELEYPRSNQKVNENGLKTKQHKADKPSKLRTKNIATSEQKIQPHKRPQQETPHSFTFMQISLAGQTSPH